MGNYPYIIAGLPALTPDWRTGSPLDWEALVREVEALCPEKDRPFVRLLRVGLTSRHLSARFYRLAETVPCPFLNRYFQFDHEMRAIVAAHVAHAHGLDRDKVLVGDGPVLEFIRTHSFEDLRTAQGKPLARALDAIMRTENLLEREQQLDRLRWDKAESLSQSFTLDINVLLAQLVKARLVARWGRLDKETGARLFKQYVQEIQSSHPKA